MCGIGNHLWKSFQVEQTILFSYTFSILFLLLSCRLEEIFDNLLIDKSDIKEDK